MLLEKNWQHYPTSQEGALELVNMENISNKDILLYRCEYARYALDNCMQWGFLVLAFLTSARI